MVFSGRRNDYGRFRSGKQTDNVSAGSSCDRIQALITSQPEPNTPIFDSSEIPRLYRKVEIEYSKFGVEDFDFGSVCWSTSIVRELTIFPAPRFYNKTDFSGLETHILNSYTNSMLQVMHYVLSIRRLSTSHTTTSCLREHCLLCELGFVVRMLEVAQGTNCQASNFCKTVGVLAQCKWFVYLSPHLLKRRTISAKNAIDIIDYGREPTEVDYAHMIQSFHRFLLDHLSLEGNTFPHNPHIFVSSDKDDYNAPAAAPITQLLGIDAKNVITCTNCHAIRDKENMTHIVDLLYPRKVCLSIRLPRE